MCVIVKGEEKIKARAGERLIANMANPSFAASLIGADQLPCFCCLRKANGSCPHASGSPDCKDYVLYSQSPEEVERMIYKQIELVHEERVHKKKDQRLINKT